MCLLRQPPGEGGSPTATTSISMPITLVVNGQWITSNPGIHQSKDIPDPSSFLMEILRRYTRKLLRMMPMQQIHYAVSAMTWGFLQTSKLIWLQPLRADILTSNGLLTNTALNLHLPSPTVTINFSKLTSPFEI